LENKTQFVTIIWYRMRHASFEYDACVETYKILLAAFISSTDKRTYLLRRMPVAVFTRRANYVYTQIHTSLAPGHMKHEKDF
jgi:hypothetical protein